MAEGAPHEWIEGCRHAHAALLADLEGLTDSQARGPSRLPGWTVGHLLSHIARNGDSVVRRLDGAVRGEVLDQYAGGIEGRKADIEHGAGRPAAALVDDVRQSAAVLERTMDALPSPAWDALSRTSRGIIETCREAVFARWREVAVHHGDLGLRSGPVELPPQLINDWLPRELAVLAERTDPATLMAWVIGRGPAPDLTPW